MYLYRYYMHLLSVLYRLYVFILCVITYLLYVFIICVIMYLLHVLILCICLISLSYVFMEQAAWKNFRSQTQGRREDLGKKPTPHCLHFMSLFQFPCIEMQTGHRGGAWPEFHQFSLGNTAARGNPGPAECRAELHTGRISWGVSLGAPAGGAFPGIWTSVCVLLCHF